MATAIATTDLRSFVRSNLRIASGSPGNATSARRFFVTFCSSTHVSASVSLFQMTCSLSVMSKSEFIVTPSSSLEHLRKSPACFHFKGIVSLREQHLQMYEADERVMVADQMLVFLQHVFANLVLLQRGHDAASLLKHNQQLQIRYKGLF